MCINFQELHGYEGPRVIDRMIIAHNINPTNKGYNSSTRNERKAYIHMRENHQRDEDKNSKPQSETPNQSANPMIKNKYTLNTNYATWAQMVRSYLSVLLSRPICIQRAYLVLIFLTYVFTYLHGWIVLIHKTMNIRIRWGGSGLKISLH